MIDRDHFHPLLALGLRLLPWLAGITLYCVVVGVVVAPTGIRPLDWGAEASLANTLIIGLLLGFRNRAAYDRWWEARRLWGQLINDVRNLACKVSAALLPEVIARDRVGPLLTGFAESLKQHLRDGVRLREVAGFEDTGADPAHVPLYLAGQVLRHIISWRREDLIDTATTLMLDVHARALLDICGACERIKNTPIAPSYTALLRAGILLNILVTPWYSLPELGYWGIPVLLPVFFFLMGIEVVDTLIEDPFGTDWADLALDRYCKAIEESVRATSPGPPPATATAGLPPACPD